MSREIVALRYLDDQPVAEIAAALRLSENATRMHLKRALKRLRLVLNAIKDEFVE